MKLLVILSRLPYPLEKGDKLRAFHQLKELSRRHEIVLCCLTDKPPADEHVERVKSICRELHVFTLSKWRIYLNLIGAVFSKKPFQVHYFYQRRIHKPIQRIISEFHPDHIFCQLIRTAEYAKHEYNYPKTIDYQDAFSKGMERRAERASFPWRELFNWERRRLVAYENITFEYFENKVIISEEDRRYIYHPEREDIRVITNGIDTDFFAPDHSSQPAYDLVFVGNMSYAPNVETALYIVEKVLPILREKIPDISLLIAGASPVKRIAALGKNRGVTVKAGLKDIREAYAAGRIFFAPMLIGTGLQNKLLEAMSMQKPCVTSVLANRALGGTHGENILVGDAPEVYADLIAKLLENNDLCRNLGKKGREYVASRFSWSASGHELERVMSAQKEPISV
jgi:sugar transferase (PEP-CTERM/EpsH1 system associated)